MDRDKLVLQVVPVEEPVGRLVCLGPAGAGASQFWGWHAPPRVELCALRVPGRESLWHWEPIDDMTALVDLLAEVVTPLTDRRYVFAGICWGSLVLFEVIRELRRRSVPLPAWFFAVSHAGPATPRTDSTRRLSALPAKEALAELGYTQEAILESEEFLELLAPALRADLRLEEDYRYRADEPLPVPATVVKGTCDDVVADEDLRAWEREFTAPVELVKLEGDHLFSGTYKGNLAAAVANRLTPLMSAVGS